LALMGDKVDNIPGVPGIGEKTALGLLIGVGGGLDVLYANLDKVPALPIRGAKTLPAKLEEHREAACLSYRLATIKLDVPLELGIDQLVPGEPDREALRGLYEELEFKGWLDELLREARSEGGQLELVESSAPSVERRYETVLDWEHFERWLQRLACAELIAFDTETTGV